MNHQDGNVTTGNMTEQESRTILAQTGYEDVTEEANAQIKRSEYAVFLDPSGVGVHYCFEEEDVIELAELAL